MHRLPKHEPIRVFEGFAGYGGATFGLRRAKINHKVIGFSEIDNDAIELYHYNFPNIPNLGDITKLDPTNPDLPDFDMFTGGFPCQPFSTVGKRQGVEDERGRGTLFGDIIRICEVKRPKYILLENVKGLLTGRMKATFNVIIDELRRIGYDTRFTILNSKDYGIPQTRERLWIFAYLGTLPENFIDELIHTKSYETIAHVIPQKGAYVEVGNHVLIGLVKEDNRLFQAFMDGTATLYYSGKQFPTTIALQDLHFFMPYIKGKGIRDVYEIVKVRTITGKEAKQTDEDDADSKALRLAFELRYVRKQYAEFQPIDTTKMIGYTFVDTTFDKLDECVIIDKL